MDATVLKKLEFDKITTYAARFCFSAMGRDLLAGSSPFADRAELMVELERVLELKNLLLEKEELPFTTVPDTREILAMCAVPGTVLAPEAFRELLLLLMASVQLRQFVVLHRQRYPLLHELTAHLWVDRSLRAAIARVVDEHAGILDDASEELAAIRQELRTARERIRRRMDQLLRHCSDNGWLMDDSVTIRNGRLTLGLKIEYRYKVPGYVQDYSGSGLTVFIEPAETLEISNGIQELKIRERREIERILRELTDLVREDLPLIEQNQGILAVFDCVYAKARLAVQTASVLPRISRGHALRIVRGMHPWLLLSHRDRRVMPLDLELDEAELVLVISGPNAGGKSVAMKGIGLLCCLLMHGYLVPCSESSLFPLFKAIHMEIGDEQSIEQDFSTFSSHLLSIKGILERAGRDDLVLIDELCAGTAVEEGGAIARAILERLREQGTKTIVTTHIGDLKLYAHEAEGVVNGAMEFDREHLGPTFRFLKGLPGNSFAFSMMERLGFASGLISSAKGFMNQEQAGLERLLVDLGRVAEQNRTLQQRLDGEQRELQQRMVRVQEQERLLQRRQQELKMKANRTMQQELEHARKEIREILQAVRNAPADAQAVHEARRKLGQKKSAIEHSLSAHEYGEAATAPDGDVRVGDVVRLRDSNSCGEVEEVLGKRVVVRCGHFRVTTAVGNIEKTTRKALRTVERARQQQGGAWSLSATAAVSTTLDVRGERGEAALAKIDRFIDKMIRNRIFSVTIIHGKGDGILRRLTAGFLTEHRAVKEFKSGEWNTGGDGVTVVELR